MPRVRTGQTPTELSKPEFLLRWRQRFYDPAFDSREEELKSLAEIAWQNYRESRKSPRTRKAGPGFADPECELSVEWLDARDKIIAAQKQHESRDVRSRILLICASPRTDQTCPSEMSKTFRLTEEAKKIFAETEGSEVDLLDLSVLEQSTAASFFPVKPVSQPRCHFVIGLAVVTRIITSVRRRIGCTRFIHAGWPRMAS